MPFSDSPVPNYPTSVVKTQNNFQKMKNCCPVIGNTYKICPFMSYRENQEGGSFVPPNWRGFTYIPFFFENFENFWKYSKKI